MTFPYYINHLIIACAISAVVWFAGAGTFLAGAVFYAAREVWQRKTLGYWDWPGLLWPVVPICAAEVVRIM